MTKLPFACIAALTFAAATYAADLGDPAAPLDIQKWVKGEPVDLAEGKGKNIYVIEFWATWCPPCLTSIPHLTELQQKFKDDGVVIIGVSSEQPSVVQKFVEKMGDKMDYTVAVDDGKTAEGYMLAYGQSGIPQAFIVDKDGRVVWRGSPMLGLEAALKRLVEGKFDLSQARDEVTKLDSIPEKLQEYIALLSSETNEEKASQLEQELAALDKQVGGILQDKPFEPAEIRRAIKFNKLVKRYQQAALQGGDTNDLAAIETDIAANQPKDFNMAEFQEQTAVAVATHKAVQLARDYFAAVGEPGDKPKADELAKQLDKLKLNNPQLFSEIGRVILTDPAIKTRDTDLALKLTRRAVDATESKDARILNSYALALFESGDTSEAVARQKTAIELENDESAKAAMKEMLSKYEAKLPSDP